VLVIAAPEPVGAEKPLNAFETLTLAPIDRRLIDVQMLTSKERAWVDSYHERVNEMLGRLVDPPTRKWLEKATQALNVSKRQQPRRASPRKRGHRPRSKKR
jgi:Xaa-Pro aminopeptidase